VVRAATIGAVTADNGDPGTHGKGVLAVNTFRSTVFTASLLLFGACAVAAKPVAADKLAVAQSSLERAEQAQAGQFAQVELKTARDKLAAAQAAADKHKKEVATRLAEEADLEAQLAEATARAKQQEQLVSQMEASLQDLRNESQRNHSQAQ
jgi:septal ring factor EnvC (AmiA/AmiB activator)